MANFGTYEGHKILAQGMANTVQTVKDGFNFKENKRQFQETFDQNKLEQDRRFLQHVREENRRFELDEDKFEHQQDFDRPIIDQNLLTLEQDQAGWDSKQAAEEYIRNQMINAEAPLIIDQNGTLVVSDEFDQIVQNYDTITSLEAIQAANPDMTYDDAVRAQTALTDKYKTGFLNLKKQFVGKTDEWIDKFFKENKDFAKAYDRFLIDAGTPRGSQTFSEHMSAGDPEGEEDDEWTIPGYGEQAVVYGDKDGWGGGIEFKGPNAPSDTEQDHARILLEALETSKNNETDFDKSDTIEVFQQGGGKFLIEENDSWLWGNETWQGRVNDKGVAQILVNDKWIDLSTFDKWESVGY